MFDRLRELTRQADAEAARVQGLVSRPGLLETMQAAAEAFVDEAERRGTLDLDLAEAFKGLVIEAAAGRKGGDRRDTVPAAFVLLGKAKTVRQRNHWATWEREEERVSKLRAVLVSAPASAASSSAS